MQALYVGIMSGTSMDGIDAVMVDLQNRAAQVIQHVHVSYPHEVRTQLLQLIRDRQADLELLGRLHTQLGTLYADSVEMLLNSTHIKAGQVKAIGLHGQTIFHAPDGRYPFTWQLGNAHVLAVETHIPVIADFRGLDVALQGQGAPLAPIFHLALFGALLPRVAVLNLGGIANVTLITEQEILKAFDTGPASCLLDAWMLQEKDLPYDKNGAFSRSGKVIPELLAALLHEAYFQKMPPKSTGRELFNLNYLAPHLKAQYSVQDVAATLTELTAVSIAEALVQNQFIPDELIVCGGGAHNQFLLERLRHLISCKITTSLDHGFKAETIEAVAFAYLAKMFMENQKINLKNITGAVQNHLCGVKYTV